MNFTVFLFFKCRKHRPGKAVFSVVKDNKKDGVEIKKKGVSKNENVF